MASTMTVLAMGGIFFPEGYTKAGQTGYLLDAVKWGTDYFIKCHVSANEFYGQVGKEKSFVTNNIIEMLPILHILASHGCLWEVMQYKYVSLQRRCYMLDDKCFSTI